MQTHILRTSDSHRHKTAPLPSARPKHFTLILHISQSNSLNNQVISEFLCLRPHSRLVIFSWKYISEYDHGSLNSNHINRQIFVGPAARMVLERLPLLSAKPPITTVRKPAITNRDHVAARPSPTHRIFHFVIYNDSIKCRFISNHLQGVRLALLLPPYLIYFEVQIFNLDRKDRLSRNHSY